jgi:ribosome-associated heat shock protein Hsp15
MPMALPPDRERIDKWLWAARFFKTRALAVEQLDLGRIQVAGSVAKPAREVKPGDEVRIRHGAEERVLTVRALSLQRGPAAVAQTLYDETPASRAARERLAAKRKLAPEPALTIERGRPTKRDRRALDQQRRGQPDDARGDWDSRWSASWE